MISDPYRLTTVHPAKRAYRHGTTALHRTHSAVTPELMATLGFLEEQQLRELQRARSAMVHAREIKNLRLLQVTAQAESAAKWAERRLAAASAATGGLRIVSGIALTLARTLASVRLPRVTMPEVRLSLPALALPTLRMTEVRIPAFSMPTLSPEVFDWAMVPTGVCALIGAWVWVVLPHERAFEEAFFQRNHAQHAGTTVVPETFTSKPFAMVPKPLAAPAPKPVDATIARLGVREQNLQAQALPLTAMSTVVSPIGPNERDSRRSSAKKHLILDRTLAAIPSLDPTSGGELTSGFGYRTNPYPEFHQGLDLAQPTGHPVLVSGDGVVTFAGWSGGFGNKIEVDHGNGYVTWYGHLSRVEVSVGEHVARGKQIGDVGATGDATGPHLHYQIMYKGSPIDPTPFLGGVPRYVIASTKTR